MVGATSNSRVDTTHESVRQGLGGLDGGWAGMLRPERFIVPPELPSTDDTLHLVH